MNRRSFVFKSTLASSFAFVSAPSFSSVFQNNTFQLNYAPHFGMFKESAGTDLLDQLQFMYNQGFRAFEDNDMKNRPLEVQEAIANKLNELGMKMGVFVAHKIYWNEPNLASGDSEKRSEFLNDIRNSVEVAKRVGAKWMTVVPGTVDQKLDAGYQTSNVVESLRQASEILEPHKLVMVLEPLNFRDHPGMFLTKAAQAYEICKAVNSSSCKILFDIYHQQITEGNLIPNLESCFDETAYIQVGDNPGRKEPTTGEINYTNVFSFLKKKGFNGIIGMEHGNSVPGKKGEELVIEAYRKVDQS